MQLEQFAPFWKVLTPNEQAQLNLAARPVHYDAGEIIIGAGKECLGILLVRAGELAAYLLSEEGRQVTLFHVRAGEVCILSASCVLHEISFDVFVEATRPSDAILLPASAVSKIKAENLRFENYLYRQTVERFRDVLFCMQQILFFGFDRRLAHYLLEECEHSGSQVLNITQEQIAHAVGSAREVVSRMAKHFAADGLIKISRGKITVCNPDGLKRVAQGRI